MSDKKLSEALKSI